MCRSTNCYCSANFGSHGKIEGLPVGKHPEVCTLLTRVFNLRSPQPRYSSTWDVQIVPEFTKNNWTDNKSFPNKNLILELTMLLVLTSASRASSIHYLEVCFMTLSDMFFSKLLKIWKKKDKALPKLFAFKTNLFVIQRVSEKISKMERWKKDTAFIRHR